MSQPGPWDLGKLKAEIRKRWGAMPLLEMLKEAEECVLYVVSHERPLLQKLHQMRRISLSLLRPLEVGKHQEELVYLGRFLRKKIDIAHLACHAYMQEPLFLLTRDDNVIAASAILGVAITIVFTYYFSQKEE